jgi:hypothetical protein
VTIYRIWRDFYLKLFPKTCQVFQLGLGQGLLLWRYKPRLVNIQRATQGAKKCFELVLFFGQKVYGDDLIMAYGAVGSAIVMV